MEYTLFYTKPDDFVVQAEASGCYFWCNERLLLVKRNQSKSQGGTWGVPAGKLEANETALDAVIREIEEEIGVDISQGASYISTLYVRLPHLSYAFHMFYKQCDEFPEIALKLEENIQARWVTFDQAYSLPLVKAGKEALELFQEYLSTRIAL